MSSVSTKLQKCDGGLYKRNADSSWLYFIRLSLRYRSKTQNSSTDFSWWVKFCLQMNRLRSYVSTLQLLHKVKPSLQKAIIANGNDQLVRCICNCALNALTGSAPITQQDKRCLGRHKDNLRKLINRRISLKNKRKVLQTEGFLGVLLSAVIPTISSLLCGLAQRWKSM